MKRILKGALVALMVVSSTIGVKAESKISAEVQRIIDSMTPVEKSRTNDSGGYSLDHSS